VPYARAPRPPRSQLLPGQLRYCDYLARVLHNPALLPDAGRPPLLLSAVACHQLGVFVRGAAPAPRLPAAAAPAGASPGSTPRQHLSASSSAASLHPAVGGGGGGGAGAAQTMLVVFCGGQEVWRGGVVPGSIDEEVRSRSVVGFFFSLGLRRENSSSVDCC
jgi:hypothetical protein